MWNSQQTVYTKLSGQVAAPPSIVPQAREASYLDRQLPRLRRHHRGKHRRPALQLRQTFLFFLHFTFLCCHLRGKVPKTGLNHQADTSQVTLPQVREKRVEREERVERVERANCKKHFRPKVLGTAENTSYGRKSLFRPKITVTAVSP